MQNRGERGTFRLLLWQLGMDYATSEVTEGLVLRCVSGWRGDRKQALGGHGAFSPGVGAEWRCM